MDRMSIETSLSREEIIYLPTPDGKKIYVCVNRAGDTPSQKAVVIGHGLGGSPNGYVHMMARNYFTERGYDVYRMAYYWDEYGCRKLHECTLAIHAQDMNSVLDFARGQHDKIYVCGHSYGGLTLVFANPQADAVSFWDPSYQPWERLWLKSTVSSPDGVNHLLKWEYLITIGSAMYEEGRSISRDSARALTQKITAPSQVIVAGQGWLIEDTAMLYEDLVCVKERQMVTGAGHCFTEGQTIYELLDKTHHWFDKY
ncbi:MAG: hypothetical protein WC043_05330 [Pseudobdellovibrionaceae bacterium]